ncbi:hypothetical protein QEH59_10635 [Coraliomargarita sp. SDUM461004]|uniref:DUF4440 domain-containing protein n=1 Tax=Thalassobacterium sedimentorum TaxID=3041258 RepID=A0ABU1AJS3_9BACT|nr:hypothetical protein [Coraliomargarita sp. SDUM461004]MDQ8194884.1 hypothetical protein [Coraliomargarita sp. SDUM461004]
MDTQTNQAPDNTNHLTQLMAEGSCQEQHEEARICSEILCKLRSLCEWEVKIDMDVLFCKKRYQFESIDGAKEFVRSMGAFLRTNTVFVLVHKLVDCASVIVSMRANLSSDGAYILCEIAEESERKYQMITSFTQDAA